ncbi:MAG: peroxiredoxin [Thermoanaerobaculia bacterium]
MKSTIALAVLLLAVSSFAEDTTTAPPAPSVPAVGTAAPAFSLSSQKGTNVSLDQYRGRWVVLYFYPKDFTSGCTLEAHNFQRDLSKYKASRAVVLGVSVDNAESHKGFCAKEGLNFKLLADTDHSVSTKYGSVMDYKGQMFAARNTFLIDPQGVIRKVYVKVNPAEHSGEVLADLHDLQKAKS